MIAVVVMIVCSSHVAAQRKVPLLERTISVSFQNANVDDALRQIGEAGNFTFSYKSSLLAGIAPVTKEFVNKTVREVLDELFQGNVQYKERARYIILVKATKTASSDASTVSGYVIDEATGKRLQNVSVYDPVSLSSAVTDSYGYFKIDIKNPTGEELKLAVKKREYTDTLVVVPKGWRRLVNVPIRFDAIKKEHLGILADSVSRKLKRFWLETKKATEQAVNMENITDSMRRDFQFGLAPFIGTNGKLSGNVINRYSLNVVGGHSLGNEVLEFAGLFNTTRGNVDGVQVAGLFNAGLGIQDGVQVSGLANINADSAKGVQLSGGVNINFDHAQGARLAGLVNLAFNSSRAAMAAGLGNVVVGEVDLPQFAGMFNVSTKDTRPAQIAGLFNFTAGSMKGAQVAGLFNFSRYFVRGAQVSGFLNIAPQSITGAQVGFINVAKNVTGVQLGFINVAKSVKGVPIGFLSIVGKGYHKLEFSADEIFYTNIAFRTGVRQFYNIITVGAKPATLENDETVWSFGYGIGTAPKLSKWLYLNFDLTSSQIMNGNTIDEINLLNKLYGGFDFQLSKNFSITAGVTLNGHITRAGYTGYPELFVDYQPDLIRERDFSGDYNLKMWLGGKVGIRFF
jgi:hypothetical protein